MSSRLKTIESFLTNIEQEIKELGNNPRLIQDKITLGVLKKDKAYWTSRYDKERLLEKKEYQLTRFKNLVHNYYLPGFSKETGFDIKIEESYINEGCGPNVIVKYKEKSVYLHNRCCLLLTNGKQTTNFMGLEKEDSYSGWVWYWEGEEGFSVSPREQQEAIYYDSPQELKQATIDAFVIKLRQV